VRCLRGMKVRRVGSRALNQDGGFGNGHYSHVTVISERLTKNGLKERFVGTTNISRP